MKNKNIHLIPTDKPSKLFDFMTKLMLIDKIGTDEENMNRHIYITSEEEIKEGDWYYYNGNIRKHVAPKGYLTEGFKKIILTTDINLIKDGVQKIDDEFLEWFVKNPSCEEIEVISPNYYSSSFEERYKIIIPKEESIKCPKCRTTEFKNCHSMRCPMRKEEHKIDVNWQSDIINEVWDKDEPKQIVGAKWQQERSYSEEDMKLAFEAGLRKAHSPKKHSEVWSEWFKQFKKIT